MVCERFIGSGRLQEGGFLGTHKQDFEAHRKGCDWRHSADHIDMNPIIPEFPGLNVQETLELISSAVAGDVGLPTVLTVNNHAGSNSIFMDMQFIHEVQNPTQPQDVATKWYVDQFLGKNWKQILTEGNFSGGIDVNINQGSRIINTDAGGGFTVSLTDHPTGFCSPFIFNGADGYAGSGFIFLAGNSTHSSGGGFGIVGGSSNTVGGTISIQGGTGISYGGDVNIIGGLGSNTSGGNIAITSGNSTMGTKGNITLNAGAAIKWPQSDGSSGQAIVTDGAGNLSFATVLSGTIDHGSLSGLGDDDHTQYLLINGTRAMAGDLNMGVNNISNCFSVRAPTGENFIAGSDSMTQTYYQGLQLSTNYLLTTIGNSNVFKDTYNYSIEYERSVPGSVSISDIPNSSVFKVVFSGKQTVFAKHWGSSNDYVVQTELNYT